MPGLARLVAALALAGGIGAAEAAGWPACGPGERVLYSLDAQNATGGRHDLMRSLPEETAWFEEGDIVIARDGKAVRYSTGGGGSGLRYRVGRTDELAGDDPAATIRYIFYDLSAIAADGRPDRMLMIDGDIYWPSCRER